MTDEHPQVNTEKQCGRRFVLHRNEDVSGVSGIGVVAEGVVFHNGLTVITWYSQWKSLVVYQSLADLEDVHGHGGRTTVHWIDLPEAGQR